MKISHGVQHWSYEDGILVLAFPGGRLRLEPDLPAQLVPDVAKPIRLTIEIPTMEKKE